MPLSPAQVLQNRYRIVSLLAQGIFGAAYRAWDMSLKRPCAIKEYLEVSPEAQRQFTREAHILGRVSHPNLARVTDYFYIPDQGLYLVMDFVEGEELDNLVHQQGKIPVDQAVAWTSQVADALSYLHAQNPAIIHRDVKPENIRIQSDGRAILVDFGLAKSYTPNYPTTMGARAVTPGYSPPEQYGMGRIDYSTDLYALGATLYYLLTGQNPPESVMRLAGSAQLASPRQIEPSIPPRIDAAIMKAMELNPEKRHPSISAFIADLSSPSQASSSQPAYLQGAPRQAASQPVMMPQKRKVGLGWLILLATVFITLVIIVASSNKVSSVFQIKSSSIIIPVVGVAFVGLVGLLIYTATAALYQRQQVHKFQYNVLDSAYQAAFALEKLVMLLAPLEGDFLSSQVEGELRKLQVVFDHQQLEDTLLALSRRKLLDKHDQAWQVSQPQLVKELRRRAGAQEIERLIVQVRDEYPLYREIQQFLKDVGFQVTSVDPFGFYCASDIPLWRDISPLYTRLVVERQLDMNEFQDLLRSARQALKTTNLDKRFAMVVIDQPPSAGDLYQIFALHHHEGFTVIPLPRSLISQARLDERESQALREQVDLYTGKADLYDVRTAVSDVLSFFGRAAQLAEIKRLLTGGHSVVVFGVRKAGKSSLLARLREELAWPVASLDMEGFNQNLGHMFDEAIRAWKSAIRVIYPDISLPLTEPLSADTTTAARAQAFRRNIGLILEQLKNRPGQPGLLLFLDEMDLLLSQPDYAVFAGTLRSIAEDAHWRGRFAMLLAGLEPTINRLDQFGAQHNPFYSFFIEKPIAMLEAEDACLMVESIGGQMGVAYQNQARDLLVEAGGGHPFVTRQLCSYAVRDLERPATVDVDCALGAIDRYYKDPFNYFAQSLWSLDTGGPPGADAYLLRRLAENQPLPEQALIPPEYPDEGRLAVELSLVHLRDQSLIRRQKDGWEYNIPLYRRWVRRNILKVPEA